MDFTGHIIRPHKEAWKKGERILAASFYTVDVEWKNADGQLIKRAGLETWRVTTFHMHNDEAKSGARGSGGQTLAAAFGLAMRDRHRVFSGDFNQAHHYIRSTLDDLIATKPEYNDITYQYIQNAHVRPRSVRVTACVPPTLPPKSAAAYPRARTKQTRDCHVFA